MASAVFTLAAILDRGAGAATLAGALVAVGLAAALFRDRRPLVPGIMRSRPLQAPAPSLAGILAAVPDPMIVVDRRALVVEVSRSAEALFPALRRAQPLAFALRAPDVLEGLEAVLTGGGAREIEFAERVPVERVFQVHIAPGGTGDDKAGGAILFFRDRTQARRLELTRVDFIANASHELRTPLASVLGFIDTLRGPARDDPEARERFLAIMREQARRMARLIDDLLSLSRIELSVHVQPATELDLVPVVQHIVEALGPLAAEKGASIALQAEPGPLLVKGARDELLRVFENLIDNAVKYGGPGRVDVVIDIASSPQGEAEAAVSVRDRGPGIAAEHLPRLTERFYRVDVATSRQTGGTGLGLAIVKHIITRHRGRLVIRSEPGAGALFQVLLPLAAGNRREPISRDSG